MLESIKKIFLAYLFPKHLGTQLIMVSVCIIASILTIQVVENAGEYIEENIKNSVSHGKTLATNIASTSATLLYERDFTAIEEILIQSSAFTNISSIRITNQHGLVISHVKKGDDGKIEVNFDQTIVTPPSVENEMLITENNTISVWEQIGSGLGWVNVNYSLGDVKGKRYGAILHSLSEAAISIVIAIFLLAVFLRKPIRALKSISSFSETLGNNKGAQLKLVYPSIETQDIAASLNSVSDTLYKNDIDTQNKISNLSAYKFSTDQHSIVSITKSNGRILCVNDNFCRLSGYDENELINQNHNMVSSGVHSKEFFENMWNTILDGHVWHGEICNKNKKGGLFWIKSTIVPILNDHGIPNQFIAVSNDITEEKQYLTTLEKLSAFPQHNPHITISINAQGELMYTNMAAVKLMVKLALAKKSVQRMLPEDMMAFINASLESDTAVNDIEVEVMDMSWLWSIQPLPDHNMVLCYAVDITNSKASLHKHSQAYKALELKYKELQARLTQDTAGKEPPDITISKSSTKP